MSQVLRYERPVRYRAEVETLQQQLRALGVELEVDGRFGPGTFDAIKEFQRTNGLEVDGIWGTNSQRKLLELVAERAGIQQGSESAVLAPAAPPPAQIAALNAPNVPAGELNAMTLPQGEGHEGRYRLVTVNGDAQRGSRSNAVRSEMVLINDEGSVVWRGQMVTGGWGRGALPGMDPSTYRRDLSGQDIIAEYPINFAGSGPRPNRPTFRYADGETGYFLHLQNPDRDTMRAIGGSGRNEFGIHPGGERLTRRGANAYSAGCMKMLDDENARDFWDIVMNLPPDQRPASLEIANRDFVGLEVQMAARGQTPPAQQRYAQADVPTPPENGFSPTQVFSELMRMIFRAQG